MLPSNKSFGFFFFTIFLIIGLYLIYVNKYFFALSILIFAIIIFLVTVFKASALHSLNLLWYKFGILLGKIINPIVLGSIFFFILTPISVIFKIFKRDELQLKFKQELTYWKSRKNISNINEFFKQQF
jgi:hypothetical protein